MKKIFFLVVSIILFCGELRASLDFPLGEFNQAKELYFQNKLEDSEKILKELSVKFPHHYEIAYDLGNIYARLEQYGRAVWYFEKALRIAPRDNDLRANIKYLETKLNLQQDKEIYDQIFFWKDFLNLKEAVFISLLVWMFTMMLLWLKVIKVKKIKIGLFNFFFFLLAIYLILGSTFYYHQLTSYQQGVVLKDKLGVRVNFLDQDAIIQSLVEGQKIKVLSEQVIGENQIWYQIELSNGKKGWVDQKYIGII